MENENISSRKHWTRILYMILFAFVLYIVICLVGLIAVVQVIFSLFTGKANTDLKAFSEDLTDYTRQIVAFLLYIDNRRPFPFNSLDDDDEDVSATESDNDTVNRLDDDMHSSR